MKTIAEQQKDLEKKMELLKLKKEKQELDKKIKALRGKNGGN